MVCPRRLVGSSFNAPTFIVRLLTRFATTEDAERAFQLERAASAAKRVLSFA